MKRLLTFIAMLAFLILAGCEKKTTTESETLGKNAQSSELSNLDEVKIYAADLPAAILAYLEQNYQGYLFEEAEIEGSGAAATYTVEIRINDQDIELVFDSIGSFVGLEDDDEGEQNEREIDISELPEGVVNSIANLYPGSTILEADEITAADGSFRYEIEIQVGSENIDLMFAADGTYMGLEDDDGYYDDEDDNGDDDEEEDEDEDEDGDNDGDHENEDGE
ncbi:MAG: PepSY-like domain-containing protein [Candidatus Marinimicrobia bacterium]|nr:PepSY-like domain-containing protein [Candidatus Neomarinimicrobiota bacterium]